MSSNKATGLRLANREVAVCRHCYNRATQVLIHTIDHVEMVKFDKREPFPFRWWSYIAKCETCEELSIYRRSEDIDPSLTWVEGELIYPVVKKLPTSVPQNIRKTIDEAAMVFNTSPTAYAVLVGRALEFLCDDKKASGDSLSQRIKDLAAKNIIPPVLAQVTVQLRVLRNIAAHASEVEVKSSDAKLMKEFLNAILEYVYIAPGKISVLQASINKKLEQQKKK